MIRFDASELSHLAVELDGIRAKMVPVLVKTYDEAATDLEDAWKRNVEESSGAYSVHYRAAIGHERLFGSDIAMEVGPDSSMKQGRMAFEFGDHNHPPHLDGQRAADVEIPRLERRVTTTLAALGL